MRCPLCDRLINNVIKSCYIKCEESNIGQIGLTTDEALPCPFCGCNGEEVFFQEEKYSEDDIWYRPTCSCGLVLEARESIDEAVALWNSRKSA